MTPLEAALRDWTARNLAARIEHEWHPISEGCPRTWSPRCPHCKWAVGAK